MKISTSNPIIYSNADSGGAIIPKGGGAYNSNIGKEAWYAGWDKEHSGIGKTNVIVDNKKFWYGLIIGALTVLAYKSITRK